jgi:hypothetical protein
MVERINGASPKASGRSATQPSPAQLLEQALTRLVGEPGNPGPLVRERAFSAPSKELKEATDVLRAAVKQLPEDSPAAGAIVRGLRNIASLKQKFGIANQAKQAAFVMEFAKTAIVRGGASERDLARRLLTEQLMPLVGRLRPDEATGFVLESNSQLAAKFGLKELAVLLGDDHPVSAAIATALDRAERTGIGADAQVILSKAIRDAAQAL